MTANNQDENNTHHYSLILILHLKFLVSPVSYQQNKFESNWVQKFSNSK